MYLVTFEVHLLKKPLASNDLIMAVNKQEADRQYQ